MRSYVLTSGLIFLLIVGAHIARVVAEGPHVLHEPIFVAMTLLSLALVVWAGVSLRRSPR